MQDEPADLSAAQIVETLRHHWRIETREIEYAPVGFGSYHWRVLDVGGGRWFVTADRLSNKPGMDHDAAGNEAALLSAYATAAALRQAGLDFVVAPVANAEGELIAYPAFDWCAALFPQVEGIPCGADTWDIIADQTQAASLAGRLHSVASPSVTRRWSGAIPNRRQLEAALAELDAPWTTGPYAEPARHALRDARGSIATQLARYDRLVAFVMETPEPWVVTHGEPHQANFIKAATGHLLLVDWDTTRLAPRERDLWIVLEGNDAARDAYCATAGHYAPRPQAMALFDLLWQLTDLSIYIRRFREPHSNGADDRKSFWGVEATLERLKELPPTD